MEMKQDDDVKEEEQLPISRRAQRTQARNKKPKEVVPEEQP